LGLLFFNTPKLLEVQTGILTFGLRQQTVAALWLWIIDFNKKDYPHAF
jgi:hypothetical protein